MSTPYNHKYPEHNSPEYRVWQRLNAGVRKGTFGVAIYWVGCKRNHVKNEEAYHNFLSRVGRRPSPKHMLVRVDKDRGFTADNCRWALQSEANHWRRPNRRYSYSRDEELIAEIERRGYIVRKQ